MVATKLSAFVTLDYADFQSPFHRGNGCYTSEGVTFKGHEHNFQSPFHRGNGCYDDEGDAFILLDSAFSPLFIGAMVATH